MVFETDCQVCIFVKSVPRATQLDKLLQDCNFPSICIHSGLTQPERISRFQQFKAFEKRILVATDIFGRGIDVERVNVVINYVGRFSVWRRQDEGVADRVGRTS